MTDNQRGVFREDVPNRPDLEAYVSQRADGQVIGRRVVPWRDRTAAHASVAALWRELDTVDRVRLVVSVTPMTDTEYRERDREIQARVSRWHFPRSRRSSG